MGPLPPSSRAAPDGEASTELPCIFSWPPIVFSMRSVGILPSSTLTTPPTAELPYMSVAGPRTMSTLFTFIGSIVSA